MQGRHYDRPMPDDAPVTDAPTTLAAFAAANDAAAAVAGKLDKQAAVAAYLRRVSDATAPADDDLRRAVRYGAGRTFPTTSERVTGASGATVGEAVRQTFGLDGADWHDRVVRRGEVGEALASLWDEEPSRHAPADGSAAPAGEPLTLADLSATFDALADTGNFEQKRSILRDALLRLQSAREAAYFGKVLFGDLRTGVREGVLQSAVAEAFGRDAADVRRAALLVGDLDAVAVLARDDRLSEARFTLFHPVQFMLATPQETAADAAATVAKASGDGPASPWFAEDKLDGIRAQVHKSGDRLAMYTRTLDRTDASFPEVVEALGRLPGEFLIDGEVVPYRDGQVLPFNHIQKRLGRKVMTPKVLRDNPCVFIAFDVLYLDGDVAMDRPLRERRAMLERLAGVAAGASVGNASAEGVGVAADAVPRLMLSRVREVASEPEIAAAFDAARADRNEGLILKDPTSPYAPGRRGKAWLKLKTHLPTLDCVVTAAEHGHGKRRNSLSDYTFAVWDRDPAEDGAKLVNVGKAFSGVTDEEIAQLTELFTSISTGKYGRVHTVKPQVVMEIAADAIQVSKRHAGGYALRFPRIKRIRWDKRPEDADTVARVAEIHDGHANFNRVAPPDPEPPPPEQPGLFDAPA